MNGSTGAAARLRAIAQALLVEAEQIEEASGQSKSGCYLISLPSQRDLEEMRPRFLVMAKWAYARRAKRRAFISSELLGEPAWDMLLDLYINTIQGCQIPVTSACLASSAPTTTALRYLELLCDLGMVIRIRSDTDRRSILVKLSADALSRLDRYFFSIDSRSEGGTGHQRPAAQPSPAARTSGN